MTSVTNASPPNCHKLCSTQVKSPQVSKSIVPAIAQFLSATIMVFHCNLLQISAKRRFPREDFPTNNNNTFNRCFLELYCSIEAHTNYSSSGLRLRCSNCCCRSNLCSAVECSTQKFTSFRVSDVWKISQLLVLCQVENPYYLVVLLKLADLAKSVSKL